MTVLPLALRTPAARNFAKGQLTRIRRPASGMLRNLALGHLLWIREPFRLKAKYNSLSPTAARKFDARPYFAADLNARLIDVEQLGPEHAARSLLKAWHRHHAIVAGVTRQRLQDITQAEARAEGFGSVAAWARNWDEAQQAFGSKALMWRVDPTVLVIALKRVGGPLCTQDLTERGTA